MEQKQKTTTLREKKEFCKGLSIRQVAESLGGVQFYSNAGKSPFRTSNGRAFTIDEKRNIFTDWGYPVDDNPRGVACGDPIDFVRYLHNVTYIDACNFLWDYYHGTSSATPSVSKKEIHETRTLPTFPDLSKAELDMAYKIFLDFCPLSEKGLSYLTDRGLSQEVIDDVGFKTFPNLTVCKDLTMRLMKNGINPAAVPGLYIKKGATQVSFKKRDALIIPVRDVDGLISGLQLRFFKPLENGPKYIWFSSSGLCQDELEYEGKTPGCPIGYIPSDISNFKTLFITEGLFKALSVNESFKCPVMTVQGVGNFAGIEQKVAAVKEKHQKLNRVLIAYDADFICNINVSSHAVRLFDLLKETFPDFVFGYVIWDKSNGKGFDDLIANVGAENVPKLVKVIDMQLFKEICEEVRVKCKGFFEHDEKDKIEKTFEEVFSRKMK